MAPSARTLEQSRSKTMEKRLPTPGEYLDDLVEDILQQQSEIAQENGVKKKSSSSVLLKSSSTSSLVRKLLSRMNDAKEDIERLEKHYLNRKAKIAAELARLAQRRRKDDTERQTGNMVHVFENIEARVERVGQLASHAGDRLVKLEKRRDFARESKVLLEHFSSFSKADEDLNGIPSFFTSDKHVFEAAATAIKLRALGEKLLVGPGFFGDDQGIGNLDTLQGGSAHQTSTSSAQPPTTPPPPATASNAAAAASVNVNASPVTQLNELSAIIERIQVYCDKLENRLIVDFDKALRHKNFARMRECAKCLMLFQGGSRLISHYLASRPLFLETNPKAMEEEAAAVLETQGSKQLLDLLGRWYKHSLESVKKERVITNEVFPNADQLTDKLVQRLFEQNVQAYLTAILVPSREKILASSMNNDDVQLFLRNVAAAYEKTRELAVGLQTIGCSGVDVNARTSELFSEHLEGYPKIEFELLEAMYLSKRTSQNQDKELKYGMIEQYLQGAKESIARCMLLCTEQDRVESIQKLFSSNSSRYASSFSLLDQVYQYMIGGLQAAMDAADKACGSLSVSSLSNEADPEAFDQKIVGTSMENIFAVVKTLSTYIEQFQASLREEVIESLTPESLKDKCNESLLYFIELLENAVAQALSFGISNCLQVLGKVIKVRQKKTDFCPSEDDDMFMGGMGKVTSSCTAVVGCVRAVHALCESRLGQTNILPFMSEFGELLFHNLKQHFNSFTYNPQGALRLKRDLAEYTDVFKAIGAPAVSRSFDQFSEQVNLLVVMPESIPSLVQEDLKISTSAALFLIKLREDYKTARIDGKTLDKALE